MEHRAVSMSRGLKEGGSGLPVVCFGPVGVPCSAAADPGSHPLIFLNGVLNTMTDLVTLADHNKTKGSAYCLSE